MLMREVVADVSIKICALGLSRQKFFVAVGWNLRVSIDLAMAETDLKYLPCRGISNPCERGRFNLDNFGGIHWAETLRNRYV